MTALRTIAPSYSTRFHDPEFRYKRLKWVILSIIGVSSSVLFLYFWGIPALANALIGHMPPKWESKLGEIVAKEFASADSICDKSPAKESIEHIIEILNSATPQHPYKFNVYIVNDSDVNALAAPGGYIIVFTGLLKETKSAEELAGVLAHEMQHVLQRHATKNIIKNLSTKALFVIIFSDPNVATQALRTAGMLHYSRKLEEEADRIGMELLIKAHINPSGMIAFFETLDKMSDSMPGVLKYLSTHPSTPDRIKNLKSQMSVLQVKSFPLLPDISWEDVVKSCDS